MTLSADATAGAPAALTVADAIRAVADWTDLTLGERRDAGSALAKIVQQDGRPAGAIALTPAVVRATILSRHAAVLGVSDGRKHNITWQIRRVMGRLDLIEAGKTPVSGAWTALLGRFGCRERATLTALARFCAGRQIPPEAVDAAVLADLLAHLETRTLTPRPRKVMGAARGAWNGYCRTIPDWPGRPLPVPRAAPPVLPPSYHADLARFCDRLKGPAKGLDVFKPRDPQADGPAPLKTTSRPLRPSSIALRATHCHWAAYTLVATGFPAAAITSLAVLVEPANLGAIMAHLHQQAGGKPAARSMHVWEVLLMIARHHAKRSAADIDWIKGIAATVQLKYQRITEKNDRSVRAALEPSRDARLLALPGLLMEAARERLQTHPKDAAALAWRAVVIEILLTIPMRLENIRGLRLDRHLQRDDPRQDRISGFSIVADEVKNDQPIQVPVAPRLAAMLAGWLRSYRRHLAHPACVYLFPGYGTGNAPLTPQTVRDAVKQVTGQYVGVVLSPHQFRHLAARRFLQDNPGHYEEVRRLLGHASIATTIRAYAPAEDDAAYARLDAIIVERRLRLRRRPKTRRPRRTARRASA